MIVHGIVPLLSLSNKKFGNKNKDGDKNAKNNMIDTSVKC
jgi:hypothetical protein